MAEKRTFFHEQFIKLANHLKPNRYQKIHEEQIQPSTPLYKNKNDSDKTLIPEKQSLTKTDKKVEEPNSEFTLFKNLHEDTPPLSAKEINKREKYIRKERKAWKKTLGAEIEIDTLPNDITSKVIKKFKKDGYKLRFIPRINLGSLEDLNKENIDEHLEKIKKTYPKLIPHKEWRDFTEDNHSAQPNLDKNYWTDVEGRRVSMPALPGQWIFIQKFRNPTLSFNHISEQHSKQKKEAMLKHYGLTDKTIEYRPLEAIEMNLLGSRNRWVNFSKTNPEWTNTEYNDPDKPSDKTSHIIIYKPYTKDKKKEWDHDSYSRNCYDEYKFKYRSAIVLPSINTPNNNASTK